MYRFMLRPRWILSHLLILLLVVVMVNLGFWQLRRLDQKRAYRDLVRSRTEAAPAPIATVLDHDASAGATDAALYRRVTATGTFVAGDEVLVRNKSLDGNPGEWVLTPLKTGPDTAVVVNRGFVPFTTATEGVAPPPPTGRVTVTGLVFPTQTRGSFGPRDPATGKLPALNRADLGRLQRQVGYDIYPAYVQMTKLSPAPTGKAPTPLSPPAPDLGPHLSYAVQWFIFSTIAIVGYPMILYRSARTYREEEEREREVAELESLLEDTKS
jgi:cytochrome oxidase assembly protein ShyY1